MKKIFSLIIVVVLLLGISLNAADISFKLQSKLLLKIISYDKKLARFGDPIKIGVSSDKILTAIKANKLKIKGKSFVVEKMNSVDDMANYKVVYIDSNWKSNYADVTAKAKANSCLVFCNDSGFVESGGGTVSFKLINKKPKIVVNLGNAKEQGTDFSSGFLKITVVIGGIN